MLSVIVAISAPGGCSSLRTHSRIANFKEFFHCVSLQRGCKFEVIVVEQLLEDESDSSFKDITDQMSVDCRRLLVTHPRFNKSWLFNVGTYAARGDIFVFLDADILFGDNYFSTLRDTLGGHYLLGWNAAVYLNEIGSASYTSGRIYKKKWDSSMVETTWRPKFDGGAAGLSNVFRRDFFLDVLGGYNESYFQGGGMDNDMMNRAKAATGEEPKLAYTLLHLYHSRQVKPAPNQVMWKFSRRNPTKVSNAILEEGVGDISRPRPLWTRLGLRSNGTKKMCMSEYSYLGFAMQQQPYTIDAFSELLQQLAPSRIIELGTGKGGLAVFLGLYALSKGCKVYTFDVQPVEESVQQTFDRLDVEFIQKAIFSDEVTQMITGLIALPGTTLVLCDDGDKAREFQLFSPYLKSGDVIMAHDFYDSKEAFEKEFTGNGCCELVWDDVAYVSGKYNICPYMEDLFKDLLWLCMKKV